MLEETDFGVGRDVGRDLILVSEEIYLMSEETDVC